MILEDDFIAVEGDGELPSGWVKYAPDNTAHKFHKEELTWDKAREVCRSEGADLAVATTPQKIGYLVNIIRPKWLSPGSWLGIYRLDSEGDAWFRVDTSKFRPNPVFL